MKDERDSLVGYIPSLLDELGRDLGFFYSLDYVPDGNYGYRRADNSWDGMIGLLTQDVNNESIHLLNHHLYLSRKLMSVQRPCTKPTIDPV